MIQSAAIPYRIGADGGVEVLLITSRKRRRWILPKGNVPIGMAPHRSAAREALEEAGVFGTIDSRAFAAFEETKPDLAGEPRAVIVRTYPLRVTNELSGWAEAHQRDRKWVPAHEAARLVRNRSLRNLLERFARQDRHSAGGLPLD